jgi:molybdenum cofactor cytidylyltransferase
LSARGGHAVVLLAAGSSTRLGQPKQLLCRNGETLLHRAVRIALETGPEVLIVVLGSNPSAYQAALQDLPHETVINENAANGLASSLQAAAPHVADHAQVLVLMSDQPALSAVHLQRLLDGARRSRSGCAATQLHGLAGVPAVVPGHWFNQLPLDPSQAGFRDRLRALADDALRLLPADGLELDIDTPQDLAHARSLGLLDP